MELLVIGLVFAFLKRSSTSAAPASTYVVKPLYRDDSSGFIDDQYGPPGQRPPGGSTPAPFTTSSQVQAAIAAGRERITAGQLVDSRIASQAPTSSSSGWTISPASAQVATDVSIPRYTTPPTNRPTKHRDTTTDDIIDRKGL